MNKKLRKRWLHVILFWASAMLLMTSCQDEDWGGNPEPVKKGYVALHFSTDIPDMEVVQTRSVDPDGGGVQNMTLFCFDRYGLFITTVKAKDLQSDPAMLSGSFQAQVPEHTRIVHFVANQVMTNFNENEFQGKSEAEVMVLLEGSAGRMIYWGRFACSDASDANVAEQLKTSGNSITMLRNHAKVSVGNPDNAYFSVTGFAVYNTNAFGTVAPYHPDKGFAFTQDEWEKTDFVTLPLDKAKLSDVTDVTSEMGRFVFETENNLQEPVSVILKGKNKGATGGDLYYRVMLMQDGEQIPLRRNHDYQIHIKGSLMYGQPTFAEALKAAATNNVWISISDKVNEVQDKNYILTVAQTDYVLDENPNESSYTLAYTIKGKNNTALTDADKAQVAWLDNEVARNEFTHLFNPATGQGSIIIHLNPLGSSEKLEGTLLVKHGQLQRKIKVIVVKKQTFAPAWVGTQIYGGVDIASNKDSRAHVTLMFTVPETCPAELFPMKTYISVAGLDIRNASNMQLPIVRKGDKEWYSSQDKNSPNSDYKYLFEVKEPGVQRVYFENVLSQQAGYKGELFIEAPHFQTIKRAFTYGNNLKAISISNLSTYSNVPGQAADESILYRLVPQKKGATVQFDLMLHHKNLDQIDNPMNGNPVNATAKDEFLLYSRFLDHYTDQEVSSLNLPLECKFYPEESSAWWNQFDPNGGRMVMFKPLVPEQVGDKVGKYSIYMKTNRAKSAEVIRIASNSKGTMCVGNTSNEYDGETYRSATFELANYNPFRFGSRLKHESMSKEAGEEPDRITNPAADVPELLTQVEWAYEPNKSVDISFDVTSFMGSDSKSVDPFGTAFEIYIDAPMLALGSNPGLDAKLEPDPAKPGRFVYKVDASREEERKKFPNSTVVNQDDTPGVNQKGERKTLHFKVKDIVSAGDIILSSNAEQVVYYTKIFRVSNSSIKGTLTFQGQSVPERAFVAFEKVSDDSRIGSIQVKANGQYELRLRKEYAFNWYSDPVRFHYEKNGLVYYHEFSSLSALFSSPDADLKPAN